MTQNSMTQAILEGVNRRAASIWSLTAPRSAGRERIESFLDLLDSLRNCALLRDYLQEETRILWEDVFEDRVEDYNLQGCICLAAFDAARTSFQGVQARIKETTAGITPERVAAKFDEARKEFERAYADVESLRRDFEARWPWFDEARLARSLDDERNEVPRRPAKEVFDELRHRVRETGRG